MKYDNTQDNIAASLGISPERETEIDEAIRQAVQSVSCHEDGARRHKWNTGQVYEKAAAIEYTSPEEHFYGGIITGMMLKEAAEEALNPFADLIAAFEKG